MEEKTKENLEDIAIEKFAEISDGEFYAHPQDQKIKFLRLLVYEDGRCRQKFYREIQTNVL